MPGTHERKIILLAEDEEQLRRVVLSSLSRNGFEVIVAQSGVDALDKARQHNGPIHLLLSNVEMPEMTGVELARKLRTERPEIRIMLMSGNPGGIDVLDEEWEFIPKPFESKVLLEKVQGVLR